MNRATEGPVALKLDYLSKWSLGGILCCVLTVYVALLCGSSLLGPPQLVERRYSAWNCPEGITSSIVFDQHLCNKGVDLAATAAVWTLQVQFVRRYDEGFVLLASFMHLPRHAIALAKKHRFKHRAATPRKPKALEDTSSKPTGVIVDEPDRARLSTNPRRSITSIECVPTDTMRCYDVAYNIEIVKYSVSSLELAELGSASGDVIDGGTAQKEGGGGKNRLLSGMEKREVDLEPTTEALIRRFPAKEEEEEEEEEDWLQGAMGKNSHDDVQLSAGVPSSPQIVRQLSELPIEPIPWGGRRNAHNAQLTLKARSSDSFVVVSNTTLIQDVSCPLDPSAESRTTSSICNPILLIPAFPVISDVRDKYIIAFQLLNSTDELSWLGDTLFDVSVKSESFAIFQCLLQLSFLALSLPSLVIFLASLRRLPLRYWTIEQKWVVALLLGLVGFNDPLYVLTFLRNYPAVSLMGLIVRAGFYSLLFVFWLVLLEGVASETQARSRARWKILFALALWACFSGYFIAVHLKSSDNPLFSITTDVLSLAPFYAAAVTVLVIYTIWLCCLVLRGLWRIRTLSYRYKILYFSSILLIGIIIAGLILGILASAFSSATWFAGYQGLVNFYVIILALLFAPADLLGSQGRKDVHATDEEAQQIMGQQYASDDDTSDDSHDEEQTAKLQAAWKQLQSQEGFLGSSDSEDDEHDSSPIPESDLVGSKEVGTPAITVIGKSSAQGRATYPRKTGGFPSGGESSKAFEIADASGKQRPGSQRRVHKAVSGSRPVTAATATLAPTANPTTDKQRNQRTRPGRAEVQAESPPLY